MDSEEAPVFRIGGPVRISEGVVPRLRQPVEGLRLCEQGARRGAANREGRHELVDDRRGLPGAVLDGLIVFHRDVSFWDCCFLRFWSPSGEGRSEPHRPAVDKSPHLWSPTPRRRGKKAFRTSKPTFPGRIGTFHQRTKTFPTGNRTFTTPVRTFTGRKRTFTTPKKTFRVRSISLAGIAPRRLSDRKLGSQTNSVAGKTTGRPFRDGPRVSPSKRQPYLSPAPWLRLSMTASSEKLPGFWLGGNSRNVARKAPTYCCAGTSTKACSTRQRG